MSVPGRKYHKLKPILAGTGIGVAMCFIPLLRDFHFESAFVAAFIAAFYSGYIFSKFEKQTDGAKGISVLLFPAFIGLPVFARTLFSGCLDMAGVSLWFLLPVPAVLLSAAIGRLIKSFGIRNAVPATFLSLFALATLPFLYEFYRFPQVYFFNHIWGWWPGPIYDEEINVSSSLLFFRGLTVLWAVLLLNIPHFFTKRPASGAAHSRWIVVFSLVLLLGGYTKLDDWRVVTPVSSIAKTLQGVVETGHFLLHFDENTFTETEIQELAAQHEFYFGQIAEELQIDWSGEPKIRSFIYNSAWQKKELVGAKFTSYVPVWLAEHQMHIAKQQIENVLKHELVHVMAKTFGNKILNASYSIGMVEGLATAVARNVSEESTLHQIVKAKPQQMEANNMKAAFSFVDFYGDAGAVSYTTTGSFIRYLLDTYPPEFLKQAYKTGSFEPYEKSIDELIAGWSETISGVPVDSIDAGISERIFGLESIFAKACPHIQTPELALFDNYSEAMARKDSARAYPFLDELMALEEANDFVRTEWLRTLLFRGQYEKAVPGIPESETLLTLQLIKADALFLNGEEQAALGLMEELGERLEQAGGRQFRYSRAMREDSLNMRVHTQRRYRNAVLWSAGLSAANKTFALEKALEIWDIAQAKEIAGYIFSEELNADWFGIYEKAIRVEALFGETAVALDYYEKLSRIELRQRFKERLDELAEWIIFSERYRKNLN